MSKQDWRITAQEILDVISNLESYIAGRSIEHLQTESMLKDAVLMTLIVIGEISKQLPPLLKERYSEIEWHGIAGIRNRIAHGYFGVDLGIIWDVATNEVPRLKQVLTTMLRSEQ